MKTKTLCPVSVSNNLANKHIIIVYLVGSEHVMSTTSNGPGGQRTYYVHYRYCPGGQRTVYVHLNFTYLFFNPKLIPVFRSLRYYLFCLYIFYIIAGRLCPLKERKDVILLSSHHRDAALMDNKRKLHITEYYNQTKAESTFWIN